MVAQKLNLILILIVTLTLGLLELYMNIVTLTIKSHVPTSKLIVCVFEKNHSEIRT